MGFIHNFFPIFLRQIVPPSYRDRFVLAVMSAFNFDPLNFAYKQQGILKYQNVVVSGETFVIKNVLPQVLSSGTSKMVMFDVGANDGHYTKLLREHFPTAMIYSFEPNPNAFQKLLQSAVTLNVKTFNIGFSDKEYESNLFTYASELDSSHASIYGDVLTSIHKSKDIKSVAITLTQLDKFCEKNDISQIDFLKIDTEGNEFKVLSGAKKLLDCDAIKVIQFEFNEMNVISRVFLYDFFVLLGEKYNIYRLDTHRLLPIHSYNSKDEIFKFQNILAVHKNIDISQGK